MARPANIDAGGEPNSITNELNRWYCRIYTAAYSARGLDGEAEHIDAELTSAIMPTLHYS